MSGHPYESRDGLGRAKQDARADESRDGLGSAKQDARAGRVYFCPLGYQPVVSGRRWSDNRRRSALVTPRRPVVNPVRPGREQRQR